jgi:DNA invertase Pin-like site-specific DNA recombinase
VKRIVLREALVAVGSKGVAVGQSHPAAKLADGDVSALLQAVADGGSYRTVARAFGISHAQVGRIVHGENRQTPAVRHEVRRTLLRVADSSPQHPQPDERAALAPM